MLPIAAAALGGAAVGAASHLYWRRKTRVKPAPLEGLPGAAPEASRLSSEFWGLIGDLQHVAVTKFADAQGVIHERRQKLTIRISQSTAGLQPLREAVVEEWREFISVVSEGEGWIADSAMTAREFLGNAERARKKAMKAAHSAARPAARRTIRITPRAVWRSLKQAKDLVFDDTRSRQIEDISGPADGSARSQIAVAERTVNRYLRVAASAAAVATVGVLLVPPLKLVSGAMILYAAFPVFQGCYTDLVEKRKISVRLLDSVSYIGLLAGGYFLICAVTTAIFHASTKMMLKTEDRSRQILANLFGQQPRTVFVMVKGVEVEIPFEQLVVGDTLVIHAGQMIPVDGVIVAGTGAIDQHVLTGEAQPAERETGGRVFAATMLLAGRLEVLVEKAGSETAAAQIREILANTTDFRTAVQARWRDVADRTVLPTLGLSAVALAALSPASALAVINSNYVAVMKVASPLAMLNFLQRASQNGILIKDGRALEATGKVDTVVFDKTGTLTEAQPHVGGVFPIGDITVDDLLTHAAAVEAKQSHPIGQAILEAAEARHLTLPELDEARFEAGYGIQARIGGRLVHVGSARYMTLESIPLPDDFQARQEKLQSLGSSVVYVAFENQLAGAIELRPTLRPEAKEVVAKLRQLGLTLYIISGDQAAPTAALAAELGIDHYLAEVLPQDKSREVEKLQQQGRHVCFVGDGINDAIALKKADVSVSLRGASSLATNTAQVILMDESLRQLAQLFEVAHEYDANLRTLLTTTFAPGLVSLGGVFLLGFGNPTALLLFNLSMIAGLVNSVWPALQNLDEPV